MPRSVWYAWALLPWLVGSCGDDGPEQAAAASLRQDLVAYNTTAVQLVDHLLDMQQEALAGVTALNAAQYEAYDAYGETLPERLDQAVVIATRLYETTSRIESRVSGGASPSRGEPVAELRQPLGVLEGILLVTTAGALLKWLSDTSNAQKAVMANGEAAVAAFVENRTNYYVQTQGMDQTSARNMAMAESGNVRAHAAFSTTVEMGRTAVTSVGKQVLEQAVGTVVPGASAILHVKDAADTGALIGEYACPVWAQDVPQPRSGSCRVFVGRSQGGSFYDVTTGVWEMVAVVDGYAPNPVTQFPIPVGGDTTYPPGETLDEATAPPSQGGSGGAGGSGDGGTGGGGGTGGSAGTGGAAGGSCASFAAAVRAATGDPSALSSTCEACLGANCGASCETCMAASCATQYLACADGCGSSLDACEAACDCSMDCNPCLDACLDELDVCNASCDASPPGLWMQPIATCMSSACAAECGW